MLPFRCLVLVLSYSTCSQLQTLPFFGLFPVLSFLTRLQLSLMLNAFIAAIAAGNCAVLKPSHTATATGHELATTIP
jgi:hypothetical protein